MVRINPTPPRRHRPGMQTAFTYLTIVGDGVPEWVRVMPRGEFRPDNPSAPGDRRGPWRLTDPEAVIAASMADGALVFDVNHSTLKAASTGGEAPARGWIVEMQARDDGIYARVEWSDQARASLAAKEYRGVSPEFTHTDDGKVLRILRASLTNLPAITELTFLTSQQETRMDLVQLRAALGLPETADAAACLAAVTANAQTAATATQHLTAIATAAGLAADTKPETVVTTLTALRAGQSDVATLTAQVTSLSAQLATVQAAAAEKAATDFVDAQIAAGKPVVPTRDMWIRRHKEDPAGTVALLTALPSINAGGVVNPAEPPDPAKPAVTSIVAAVAAGMGQDATKLAAQLAANQGAAA